jgi:hypothetical protein
VKLDGRHSSTFFIIPLKNAPGSDVRTRFAGRRAARYDVGDVRAEVTALVSQGFEVGVHGIDAWRDAEAGRLELRRIAEATQEVELGIRVHWLCYDTRSPGILEEAGYDYDSTLGFNETVGYRAGTLQAFRPLGVRALLELPLHLQDTAMFLRHGLGLSEAQAWGRCMQVLDAAEEYGGVVTILWHMRSLSPERLWGGFYARLIEELQARGAWCTSARQAVRWFRQRRSVVFEEVTVEGNALRLRLSHDIRPDGPGMFLRVHRPPRNRVATVIGGPTHIDVPWTGESHVKIDLEE